MNKSKKIILIVVATIVVIAILGGIVWWNSQNKEETEKNSPTQETESKVSKLYSELEEKQTYSFTITLDTKNKIFYAKKEEMAYIDTTYKGENTSILIKDGNTHLLVEDLKEYYTYKNNETDLEKIRLQLETAKNSECTKGKEKIEGKEYQYEEYEKVSDFLIEEVDDIQEQEAKTRFYFNGDKLVYIKTIIGDKQETLKVDMSYDVDEKLFEIPTEYKEV